MAVVVGREFAVGVDGVAGWGAGSVTGLIVEGKVAALEKGMGIGFGRGEDCYWENWRCD